MAETKKSSSIEQMEAEELLFEKVQKEFDFPLQKNPKIYLADNPYTYMEPDFFSEESAIVGEIFSHIGKNKKGQKGKLAQDILKMLLLDKIHDKTYRKIIVVCDKEEEKELSGKSVLAESIRQFGIEVWLIELSKENIEKLKQAQIRQIMINI